ncbi:hypothetical protein Tco_1130060 [Tanacetum coccineum]
MRTLFVTKEKVKPLPSPFKSNVENSLERDFNLSLMGKVKDISALPNIYVILKEEGFQNLKLSYLGGLWVLIEMDSSIAKEKLINHTGVGSWFSSLKLLVTLLLVMKELYGSP